MNGKASEPSADMAKLDAEALLRELAQRDLFFAEGSAIYELVGNVSNSLKEMRNSAGLTQAELAEKLDVSQGRISQIESGLADHAPSLEMIARIAHVCEVTPRFGFDTGTPSDDRIEPQQEEGAQFARATIQSQPEENTVAKT